MSIQGFEDWLKTPAGQYVLNWEQVKHDELVADIFGFNAVQLSLPGHDFLRANRMPLRFRCDDGRYDGISEVRSDLHYLPFANNSVDLVVMPHVLEFSADPHQILREVERVLVPEGQVLISGFNPLSLWGIKRGWPAVALFPWQGQYFSVRRLKDWSSLLSFETQAGCFGRYSPAVRQEKWLRRWHFLELAGDRWWPIAGAVYVLQAHQAPARHCACSPRPGMTARRAPSPGAGGAKNPEGRPMNPAADVVEIYTDGACSGNPGPGGWGAPAKDGRSRKGVVRGRGRHHQQPHGTDRRDPCPGSAQAPVHARVHTDSQYVQKGISEWIHAWKRRGWRTADKQPVKNVDLWRELDALGARIASNGVG
jgi:SAM-dependent methyltransferase